MYYGSELAHYGVKGMKWGVRRDRRRLNKMTRLSAKAGEYSTYSKAIDSNRGVSKMGSSLQRGAAIVKRKAESTADKETTYESKLRAKGYSDEQISQAKKAAKSKVDAHLKEQGFDQPGGLEKLLLREHQRTKAKKIATATGVAAAVFGAAAGSYILGLPATTAVTAISVGSSVSSRAFPTNVGNSSMGSISSQARSMASSSTFRSSAPASSIIGSASTMERYGNHSSAAASRPSHDVPDVVKDWYSTSKAGGYPGTMNDFVDLIERNRG